MSIEKSVLKNNIVLITQSVEKSKVASLGFYFSVGSRFEKKGEYGISHFTEHMLFKGTATKSNKEISRIFDRMGGITNAWTERENVSICCSVPVENKENFSVALEALCDLSCNCIFPEEEFEKEKGVVENEIYSVEDDPDDSSMDEIARRIWKNQNISRTITGSIEDVESITREQMKSWYEKYFINGELVVIATGNIQKDVLLNQLENLPLKKPSVQFFKNGHFPEAVEWSSGHSVVKAKFSQEQIFAVFPIEKPLSYKDYLCLMVFDAVTGDSMSSRLFLELRERLGLCYSVGSFFTTYENAGLWAAYLVCEKKNAAESCRSLVNELRNILRNEITQEEIDIAAERISGTEIMNEINSAFLMRRLWNFYSMGFDLMDTRDFIDSLRTINKNDIIEFVQNLLSSDKMNVVVYGSKIGISARREIKNFFKEIK